MPTDYEERGKARDRELEAAIGRYMTVSVRGGMAKVNAEELARLLALLDRLGK